MYSEETGMILQNNSAVNQSAIDSQNGIICISATTSLTTATWLQPNGESVPSLPHGVHVFMSSHKSEGYTELLRTTSIGVADVGVYTCNIIDENNTLQILHVGLYESIENGNGYFIVNT